jgi:type II secretory pathway component PulC
MVKRPTQHVLGGPSRASSATPEAALRRLGLVAALAGLAACGSLESEEAREVAQEAKVVAKEASKEVVAASKEVAQATREVAQATKEQLDKVEPEDVERALDGVAGAVGATPKGEPAGAGADPLAGAAQAIECDEARERCTVTADFADRARQNGRKVAEQLRVEPAGGDVKGVRIEALDAGSVASLLGLKVGDVITHVNGTPIGSMQDAVMLYMNVRAARSFTLDYQRSGEARTLQLDVV